MAVAAENLDWYALRWKREVFHGVLKSGRRAEPPEFRPAARLTNLLAVPCAVGWRAYWLTMRSRVAPDVPAGAAFAAEEAEAPDRVAGVRADGVARPRRGGKAGRLPGAGDPPPGNVVVWRGITRLADICLGLELTRRVAGN